ncbi:MAG: Sel1 repeat [Verrucomicrobiales bacterium]|nr:Sel1 repeat [Verrucomicrobiales bacterium]
MLRTNIAAQPYPGWQVAAGVIEQVLPKALLVKRGQSIFYLTNYPEQSMVGVGNEVHVYARERGTNEMGGMKVMCLDFGKLANKDEIVAKIKEAASRPKVIVADQKAADSVSQEKLDKLIQFQMRQAAIGLPTAQYELGLRYLNGDGLEKQPDKARELFQKSAAQGNAEAKKQLEAMPPP